MDYAEQVNDVCTCFSRYYPYDNGLHLQCRQCPPGCVACSSQTTCTSCVTSTTRLPPESACACMDGFYEIGADECEVCSPECEKCVDEANKCIDCDTADHFLLVGTTCQCEDGYFLVIGATETTCQLCASTCLTCSGTAETCTSCEATRDLNGDDECVCKTGFQQFNGDCTDSTCQSIDPNCQTCHILLGSGGNMICKSCAGDNRVLKDNACECMVGFHEVGGECVACGEGCQVCQDENTCDLCALQSIDDNDGTCSCQKGTFLVKTDHKIYCRPCAHNCADCYEAADKCRECKNGYVSNDDDECICPDGTYEDASFLQCVSCMPRCQACNSGTTCSDCNDLTVWDGTQCALQCPQGTYSTGTECKQCSDFCKSCKTSFHCETCFSGYYKIAGSCQASCPPGTFSSGYNCFACAHPCKTCSGSQTHCTSCEQGFIFFNNQCLPDCPDGMFFNGGSCQPCDPNCKKCEGSATKCTACQANLFLVKNKCVTQCPYPLVEGKCIGNCNPGTYSTGHSCEPCGGQCATCKNSPTYCTSCSNNFLAYKGQCIQSCPANTLSKYNYCVDCDPSCNGCSINPFSCHSCKPGFLHLKTRCVQQCPEKYYPDYGIQSCKPCDANCKVCTGPGQCSVCIDSTQSPKFGQCDNACGPNCLKCVGHICKLCAEGTLWGGNGCTAYCPAGSEPIDGICVCSNGFLFHNKCVHECPSGYTQINGECSKCDSPCKECANQLHKCTECLPGYVHDPVGYHCQIIQQCPFGRYRNQFGVCVIICPPTTYFVDSTCYENDCPPGYKIDKQNQACVEDKTPSGCTKPLFLQGRECVYTCNSGYFPNPVNRVCEPCSSNCYSCLSAHFCISCNYGFQAANHQCVSSTGCTAGLFKYQNVCLPSCPPGTFSKNGYCLRICRAGTKLYLLGCYDTCPKFSTPEACVENCPAGFTQNQNTCELNTKSCQPGQYFNALTNYCQNCQFPCKTCEGSPVYCTSCVNGFSKTNSNCVRSSTCQPGQYPSGHGCLKCPQKCATCVSAEKCESCANNYINTGADCVKRTNILKPVSLQVLSVSKRDNIIFIQIRPNIIPNNLPTNLQSQFFLVVIDGNLNPLINIWVVDNDVWVALKFDGTIQTGKAYFILNSDVLGQIYQSMGYTTANAYADAAFSYNLPPTDPSIAIPAVATNAYKSELEKVNALSSKVVKAIREKSRGL